MSSGHAGIEQTLIDMHQHFHWPGLRADIVSYCKCCDAYQRQRLVMASPPDLEQPAIYRPLRHVHLDPSGPFFNNTHGVEGKLIPKAPYKSWVFLMIDYHTKVADLLPYLASSRHMLPKLCWTCGSPGMVSLPM